jgi:ABC-type multidrug transport system ATPase subunit/CRP-like cAMP-binding protein/ABC-type multidrug transport system permease subunit
MSAPLSLTWGVVEKFSPDEVFFRENDPPENIYFLIEGLVELTQNGRVVTHVGQHIGHFGSNILENHYAFTATAGPEGARTLRVTRDQWDRLVQSNVKAKRALSVFGIPLGAYLFIKRLNLGDFAFSDEEFLTAFQYHYFPTGEVLIREGEEGDTFYVLAHGRARVTRKDENGRESEVTILQPGDYFGEIALLEGGRRMATVTAVDDLSVYSLSRNDFEEVLASNKGRFIRKSLYDRISTYSLGLEKAVIGAAEHCDVQLQSDRIAPEHAMLTTSTRRDGSTQYTVKPLAASAGFMVYLNKQALKTEKSIDEHDELYVADYKAHLDPERGGISFQKSEYYTLSVENVTYGVKDRTIINSVSASAESNELVCIMGPSGCGKSTLLDVLSGSKRPQSGGVYYNHDLLYGNLDFFRSIFGFVPQDDILFGELTVFENLMFSAKLREPFSDRNVLAGRIDVVLERLRLSDRMHDLVGSVEKKGLSGGQRKRVNIARELIFDPHVLFLDEPTSGLSSKDSEEIVGFLRDIADMGKLVIVVLHQPSSKIFKTFDRIIFLDQGGRLVFTGPVLECLNYMKEVEHDHTPTECPVCGTCQPELIFDVLEKTDDHGDRVHSPEFWQKRYQDREEHVSGEPSTVPQERGSRRRRVTWREDIQQMGMLLKRTSLVKLRNRSNLAITMGVPMVIAALLGVILRHTPEDAVGYTFFENKLATAYLFVAVIFSIFMGLTNSAREIVGEQALFNLESKIKLRIRWYVAAKFLVLAVIAALQVILFVGIANTMLGIKGMYGYFFLYLYLICILGVALGLLLSSLFRSSESVVNWIPLILIPQIILGGALIEFQDMGKQVFMNPSSMVPEICQVIPSRWAHEAMVVSQAMLNPRDAAVEASKTRIKEIGREIKALKKEASPDETAIQKLNAERKELRATKALIDKKYPNDNYRNQTLEEALLQGNGSYVSLKTSITKGPAMYSSRYISAFKLNPEKVSAALGKRFFIGPFYAEEKAIIIGERLYEIKTVLVNAAVLIIMIGICLAGCMFSLYWRKRSQVSP